jgi:hypothetical protein
MTTGRASQYALLGYYVVCSVVLLAFSFYRPYHNWDMIVYAACARSFVVHDRETLHVSTYRKLEQSVPAATYRALTSGDYRRTVSEDAEAFAQQLAFYQIRILYNALVFVLATMGVNVFAATHLVSALSAIAGLWIVLLTFRPYTSAYLLFLLPPFAVAFGLLDVAKYSTPDGLAFLAVCSMAYCLVRGRRGILVLLPLSVLVRTDLILLALIVAAYLVFVARQWRLAAMASVALAVAGYILVNVSYGHYGLSVTYYMTFVEAVAYPADVPVGFGFQDYLAVLKGSAGEVLMNVAFLLFIVVSVSIAARVISGWRMPDMRDATVKGLMFVFVSSFVYVIVHLVAFPEIEERFFVGQYVLSLAVLFWLLGRNGLARGRPQEVHVDRR